MRAYIRTFELNAKITNCSNNYGPLQFPEKLIPLMIRNLLERKPLPVYGKGENVRDWLYVTDHCEAIWTVIQKGARGRDLQHRRPQRAEEHRRGARCSSDIVAEETGASRRGAHRSSSPT